MLRRFVVFTAILLLPPAALAKKKKRPLLGERIEKVIASTPALARAHVGMRVVSLDGKVVYERNPRSWFVPASNTKLYSTSMALTKLGPDYRMTTRVTAEAPPDANGIVHGDIRLVGGGDPTFSGRAYPYDKTKEWGDETPGIADLARHLALRGVKGVTGAVLGDDTAYLWDPFPDGWSIDDPLYEYGAPVSALTMQDNSMRLEVRPAEMPGQQAEVYIYPDLGQVSLVPDVRTIGQGERGRIRMDRPAHTSELLVYGTIALGAKPFSTLLAVPDPALYAAQALTDALRRQGIQVGEPARARHRTGEGDIGGDWPEILAEQRSRPLRELIQVVNKVSQNLHAELLLREVGRQGNPFGSRERGVEALREFLGGQVGLQKDDVNFVDGSGLSRLTLLTPEATTKLLVYMAGTEAKEDWFASLPVGGEDGTLSRRFQGAAAKGKIHAKTGSLSHVSALGGYLDHPRRGRLAFTILLNNYNTAAVEAREGIDKLVGALLE
ncbi:MAG: D-alanyl-D-alanine carboxypeptidase/D-alanyl-D-alanine-endopeptidase [Acidobacteria bacterium]|nr:D-alanyl-D-alanine carboxypeptidase/D-alanyl-D-alanine-endopeptidase [Acidobacteriota bacterium]